MVADLQATAGAPEAMARRSTGSASIHAGEADVILAEALFAQRDYEGAAAALERAFAIFRRDPWALPRFTQKGVSRAQVLGAQNPAIARRMIEALKEPFAVKVADHRRRVAVAFLTSAADFKALCADAIGALNPAFRGSAISWRCGATVMPKPATRGWLPRPGSSTSTWRWKGYR